MATSQDRTSHKTEFVQVKLTMMMSTNRKTKFVQVKLTMMMLTNIQMPSTKTTMSIH
jgi:hypothetical protein